MGGQAVPRAAPAARPAPPTGNFTNFPAVPPRPDVRGVLLAKVIATIILGFLASIPSSQGSSVPRRSAQRIFANAPETSRRPRSR